MNTAMSLDVVHIKSNSQEHTACRFRDEVNTKNLTNKANNVK
jgi:hypothetical protein